MQNTLHVESLRKALAERGWTQKYLAEQLGVSAQSVTNWFNGKDFPRPDKLLKLATTLHLSFTQLVEPPKDQPVVAFRKRAGTKTTDAHIAKAIGIGGLLKPLVDFLPELPTLRTQISSPSTSYARLQSDALQVRSKLGMCERSVLGYQALIADSTPSGHPVRSHLARHSRAIWPPVPRPSGRAVGAQRRRGGIVSPGWLASSISASVCALIHPSD